MTCGVEDINVYVGRVALSVRDLFDTRSLDPSRLSNLMMEDKSVPLPCEDAVTNAVNAARPLVEAMTEDEKRTLRLLIVATESGVDFGKSIGTYVHHYLGLPRHCRVFEVKQACYGGTAALQMAAGAVLSSPDPSARALVIASDESRPSARMTYAEPSQGTAAVAMVVGREPAVLAIDHGASGLCSYEVMDTCRPTAELEVGDPDLSLLSYLECLTESFDDYCSRVDGVDPLHTFQGLVFHTPFAGMVKGAHRKLIRTRTSLGRDEIQRDFERRVAPSLEYAVRVGNTYSASLYMSLCSLLDHAHFAQPARVGLFSYGSGCASEFFSGVVSPEGSRRVAGRELRRSIEERVRLTPAQYDLLLDLKKEQVFGTEDMVFDHARYADVFRDAYAGRGLLMLAEVRGWHRRYVWS